MVFPPPSPLPYSLPPVGLGGKWRKVTAPRSPAALSCHSQFLKNVWEAGGATCGDPGWLLYNLRTAVVLVIVLLPPMAGPIIQLTIHLLILGFANPLPHLLYYPTKNVIGVVLVSDNRLPHCHRVAVVILRLRDVILTKQRPTLPLVLLDFSLHLFPLLACTALPLASP